MCDIHRGDILVAVCMHVFATVFTHVHTCVYFMIRRNHSVTTCLSFRSHSSYKFVFVSPFIKDIPFKQSLCVNQLTQIIHLKR